MVFRSIIYALNLLVLTSFEATTVTTTDSQEPACLLLISPHFEWMWRERISVCMFVRASAAKIVYVYTVEPRLTDTHDITDNSDCPSIDFNT